MKVLDKYIALSARTSFSLVNLGSFPQKRMSSRLVSLLGSAPFKKPGVLAVFYIWAMGK